MSMLNIGVTELQAAPAILRGFPEDWAVSKPRTRLPHRVTRRSNGEGCREYFWWVLLLYYNAIVSAAGCPL